FPRPCSGRSRKEVSSSGAVVSTRLDLSRKHAAYNKIVVAVPSNTPLAKAQTASAAMSSLRTRANVDVRTRRAKRDRWTAATYSSLRALFGLAAGRLDPVIVDRDASVGRHRIERITGGGRR